MLEDGKNLPLEHRFRAASAPTKQKSSFEILSEKECLHEEIQIHI